MEGRIQTKQNCCKSYPWNILSISVQSLAALPKPGALEGRLAVLRSEAMALPAWEHCPRQLSPGTPRYSHPPARALPAIHPHTSILTKHHFPHKQTKAVWSVNSCPAPLLTPVSIHSLWSLWTTILLEFKSITNFQVKLLYNFQMLIKTSCLFSQEESTT